MLDVATPRRTVVDGMSRQVPDAKGAWTGPLPLGFLLVPLVLPLVPLVLLLRRMRLLPWTIEARAHPWGRRYPPIVLTYPIRGGEESRRAFGQLVEALARGEGAPRIDGAERFGQPRQPDSQYAGRRNERAPTVRQVTAAWLHLKSASRARLTLRHHPIELPVLWNSLQLVLALVLERESAPGRQVLDRARDENVTWTRDGRDA